MVKNPSLTLYAFHLHQSLADDRTADADALWHSVAALNTVFNIPELQTFPEKLEYFSGKSALKKPYYELLPQKQLSFSSVTRQLSLYPVDLNDTYMLDMTTAYPEQTLEISQLCDLNPQGCLSSDAIQASLGKTLSFYAETEQPTEELAKQYLIALLPPTQNWQFIQKAQGQLWGSSVWEYQLSAQEKTLHVLVWLGNAEMGNFYKNKGHLFISLLCSYHKIHFAYQQAREANTKARELYPKLEKLSQNIKGKEKSHQYFKQLDEFLQEITVKSFEFSEWVRNLSDHETAIAINTTNYETFLKKLALPNDDVKLWETFCETAHRFQQQVAADSRYLVAGERLFQHTVNSVQGIVEINSLENSHRLEFIVVTLATTLEATAISAKVNHHLTEILHFCNDSGMLEHYVNILLHLICVGVPFGALAALLMWLWQSRHS